MSLSSLFNIATSALTVSNAGLSVTSNNIANANTPGYSRQDVVLTITSPVSMGVGLIGSGVSFGGIKSFSDRFIQAQLFDQEQNAGRSDAMSRQLSQVEQLFNEARGSGLSASLSAYFNAWNDVASDPTSQTPRTVLLQKAGVLVSSAQTIESSVLRIVAQTGQGVDNAVTDINSIGTRIAALNGKIVSVESGNTGARANELRDQRDELVRELSGLIGNASYENQDGSLTVTIGMRNLVSGTTTNTLSTTLDLYGNKQLMLDNANITSQATTGTIGGLLAAGNEIQTNTLFGLRKLIASVTQEINLLHRAGYGLDASTGNDFFSSLQIATKNYSAGASITASVADLSQVNLDEYTVGFDGGGNYTITNDQTGAVAASGVYVSGNAITFDGIQITITGAVTAADTFSVSPLTDAVKNFGVAISDGNRIAASSSAAQLPGNNANALLIAQSAGSAITNLGNGTFSGYYQGIVSGIAALSLAASDSNTFDQNLLTQITRQRDSVSGVSLDEEAANLIRYQRAYEAGAKMIKIADELLQTVLSL